MSIWRPRISPPRNEQRVALGVDERVDHGDQQGERQREAQRAYDLAAHAGDHAGEHDRRERRRQDQRVQVERAGQRERPAERRAGAGARGVERARAAAVDGDQAHRVIALQRQLLHPVGRRRHRERVAQLALVERAHAGVEALLVERGHDPDELLGARLEREHEAHAVAAPHAARRVAVLVEQLERPPIVAETREHAARLGAVLELRGAAHAARPRPARDHEPRDLLRAGRADRRAGRRHALRLSLLRACVHAGACDVLALHPARAGACRRSPLTNGSG